MTCRDDLHCQRPAATPHGSVTGTCTDCKSHTKESSEHCSYPSTVSHYSFKLWVQSMEWGCHVYLIWKYIF